VSKKDLFVYKDCQPVLNAGNIPAWCVLNGLFTEPVPDELTNLSALENKFIQKAIKRVMFWQ